MAEAIKCDLTGDVVAGAGIKTVSVHLGVGLLVQVEVFRKTRENQFEQGYLCPKGVKLVEDAVRALEPVVKSAEAAAKPAEKGGKA